MPPSPFVLVNYPRFLVTVSCNQEYGMRIEAVASLVSLVCLSNVLLTVSDTGLTRQVSQGTSANHAVSAALAKEGSPTYLGQGKTGSRKGLLTNPL